jgi:hypothetical protein
MANGNFNAFGGEEEFFAVLLFEKCCCDACREDIVPLTEGGVLFAALGNHHYMSFVLNWVYFMNKANITNYLVGALDEDLVEVLVNKQIHTILVTEGRQISSSRSRGPFLINPAFSPKPSAAVICMLASSHAVVMQAPWEHGYH